MPDEDDDVLAANLAFYDAFRGDDLAAMDALWAHLSPVACIHPGWPPLIGRAEVMASWRGILAAGSPPIRVESARALRLGDVAYVVCYELVPGGRLVATNLYVREDDEWRIVHHHASQVHAERDDDDRSPSTVN